MHLRLGYLLTVILLRYKSLRHDGGDDDDDTIYNNILCHVFRSRSTNRDSRLATAVANTLKADNFRAAVHILGSEDKPAADNLTTFATLLLIYVINR